MSGQFFEERPFTAEFLEASIQVVKRVGFHPTPKMADDLKLSPNVNFKSSEMSRMIRSKGTFCHMGQEWWV